MKRLFFLCVLLIFVFVPVFCYSDLVCFAADYNTIGRHLDTALKLKETGDTEGAISSIQRVLEITNAIDSLDDMGLDIESDEGDMYTKEYLQFLIECLRADEITYIAIIKYTASLAKKTTTLFLQIEDELRTGEISAENASSIKKIKQEMSRALVTHSFCVPPAKHKEVYNVIQEALFRYSKAWGNLYLVASENTSEKASLELEALLNFQRGNELFSRAGTLMLAIAKR